MNATLDTLARQCVDSRRLEGSFTGFGTAELNSAFSQALRGEVALVESDSPPLLGVGQGLWRLHFLPFSVGEERGAAILFEDITESRLASEAFQAAEQRFRSLIDSAVDGVLIHRSLILLYVNPEAVRLFGYQSPDELVGRPLMDLVDAEHRAHFDVRVTDGERDSRVFETVFLRRDSVAFPVECSTSQARIDEMGAAFLFFRDITERRRLQARRENARRVESLARLAKTLGGELTEHVVALRRGLASAQANALPPERNALANMSSVVDAIAARADALSLPRVPEVPRTNTTSLEEVVARICAGRVPASTVLRTEKILPDLVVDLEPSRFALRGESAAIETGLSLLITAALQSRTNSTPVRIGGNRVAPSERHHKPSYRLAIAVGKPKLQNPNVATPAFGHPLSTFGAWEQGQNLDLLGAFSILQSQGCWVDVQTSANGSLSFDVELPLDPGHSVDADSEEDTIRTAEATIADSNTKQRTLEVMEPSPDTERSHSSSPTGPKPERAAAPVLICDDEARLVALTAGLLREFGFEVLTVRSGADAVRMLSSHPIDVVILDVNLPGEDAKDVVKQLRSLGPVSVILSSGYTEEDIEPALLNDVAVKAFLAKPYGVETLVGTIDRVRQQTTTLPTAGSDAGNDHNRVLS
jgi:PAS domain S-box-containing protein